MWRWLLGIALLVGIALGVVFGALNPETVTLNLLALEWTATLGTIVTLAFCAGAVVGAVSMGILRLLHRPRRRVSAQSNPRATAGQDSIASDA